MPLDTIRLFVYGGLMSSEIRKYKKVKVQAIRFARITGFTTFYERKVSNCKKSMYHVPHCPCDLSYGMLNLRPKKGGVVYGKTMYVTPRQLKRIRDMEPGYDMVQVDETGLMSLTCVDPKLLCPHLKPNPIYKHLVDVEITHVKKALS